MSHPGAAVLAIALAVFFLPAGPVDASDCTQTSIGVTPLNDLGTGLYLGEFQGGLYPVGQNFPPPGHHSAGLLRAGAIVPRLPDGAPSPNGRYALLSIGMSNTTQEFCCGTWTFMGQAAADPTVNHTTLAIVNGAAGGQAADAWDDPTEANYDRIRNNVLIPRGLDEPQVQSAWVKLANRTPSVSLPAGNADAYVLLGQLGNIARAMKQRYPNLQQIFLSSRIYAGYATTGLNPEPYAYESGFAVKWLIAAQIRQMATGEIDPIAGDLNPSTVAPWLAWGPYLWADGLTPRSDGLTWECADLQDDGTHPSTSGEEKVADLLMDHFLNSPYTAPWFRSDVIACPGDLNENGVVNLSDLSHLLSGFGTSGGAARRDGDADGDGDVDLTDLSRLLADFGRTCTA